MRRLLLLSLLSTLLLACGDDPATTTDTLAPDSADVADVADTAPPEDTSTTDDTTADTASPDAADTASPDAADTASPDAGDTASPDAEDAADTASPDVDDAADTASPDTSTADATDATGDTTEPDTTDVADTSPTPTTWAEVHPIFTASCGGCHGGNSATSGSGGHAIGSPTAATAYQAAKLTSKIGKCNGKTVAECALLRIRDGSMPATGDCAQTPPGPLCPDSDEQALIEKWIADGMLE